MEATQRTYLPAAGRDWALPLYDPLVKLLGGDAARKTLIAQAALQTNPHVLDIGCGTGTLATMIKRRYPTTEVVGLDPDPKALTRAIKKAAQSRVSVQFDKGFSHDLPYRDASFDRVFSSFMFHHLRAEDKEKSLREARRVLRPGGSLHLLDFAEHEAHHGGWLSRRIHASHNLKDNSDSKILQLMRNAGFANSERISQGHLFFGLLHTAYYRAS